MDPPSTGRSRRPAILDDFRSIGYETITVSSGFEQVAVRGSDQFLDPGQINEFEIQLLRPSLSRPLRR